MKELRSNVTIASNQFMSPIANDVLDSAKHIVHDIIQYCNFHSFRVYLLAWNIALAI